MIPHVIVLEPGLVILKIYNGYWFFGRPTIEELRQDLRAMLKNAGPTGTSQGRNLKRHGKEGAKNSSIRTARHTSKRLVKRNSTERLVKVYDTRSGLLKAGEL